MNVVVTRRDSVDGLSLYTHSLHKLISVPLTFFVFFKCRHKCIQVCCIDPEHICPLVCQRPLSCGKHRCEALCHAGNCNRCYNVSFDGKSLQLAYVFIHSIYFDLIMFSELRCQCGTQVIYPPVPCGARPPDCTKPCTRMRTCGHPQLHNCHPDATPCPPCVALCEKFCYGKSF